jgi:CRISPR/Cas system CSM-associated protein Csm3 (group 7 of RAMP superfamily)
MHRLTCNELRLDFEITPASPLCIPENSSPPLRFVRSVHPDSGISSVYIPGSTLKGTLRRAAEHVLEGAGLDCCDAEHPCAERPAVKQAKDAAAQYRALCPACRLFGSSVMRSHVIVTDCFPAKAVNPLPARGSDAVETVIDETFYGTLSLRNFERWQVGLLSLLVARLNLADVQIGARRAEGMGCVSMRYMVLSLLYPGLEPDTAQQERLRTRLHGVGQLLGPKNAYRYTHPDVGQMPDLPDSAVFDMGMGFSAVVIADEDTEEQPNASHHLIDNVLTNQALAWGSYVRSHKSPQQAG